MGLFSNFGGMLPGQATTYAIGEEGGGAAGGLFNPLPSGFGNITYAVGESGGSPFLNSSSLFSFLNPNPFVSLFPFSSSFPMSSLNPLGLNSMILGGGNMTMALGESGGGLAGVSLPGVGNSTFALGEEGGGISSFGNTTYALGEEGGGYTGGSLPGIGNITLAVGESGGGLAGLF